MSLVPLPDFPFKSPEFLEAYWAAVTTGKRAPSTENRLIKQLTKKAFQRAQNRSRERRIDLTITERDILKMLASQKYKCAVSGIKFTNERVETSARMPFSPSVDRITPRLGYVNGNVRLVCAIVNQSLGDFGDEAFLRMCRRATNQERKTDNFFNRDNSEATNG